MKINEFIIYDTEYTSWEGCNENGWDKTKNQYKEIVQIAAIKVDNNFNIIDKLNLYIKPVKNPKLSEYFKNLTHIKQETIDDKCLSLTNAYKQFEYFAKNLLCISHSAGMPFDYKSDAIVIKENFKLLNLDFKTNLEFKNIGNYLSNNMIKYGFLPSGKYIPSGEYIDYLNIQYNGNAHNALYDCYSLLEAIKYFNLEKKEELPF